MVGPVKRFWQWFWRPSGKYTWGGIFVVGGIAGIVFWGGFNTFMEYDFLRDAIFLKRRREESLSTLFPRAFPP